MDDLQKYQPQPPGQEVVQFEGPVEDQSDSAMNLAAAVFRRWPVLIATFVIVCAVGVPAIWFLVEKNYVTEGAIQISPVESPILFDTEDRLPNYQNFMNTQAQLFRRNNVLNQVADDLAEMDIVFFRDAPDLVLALRDAIVDNHIIIEPVSNTELLKIKMTTQYPEQAEKVIDALIRAYKAKAVTEEVKVEDQRLAILDEERRSLEGQVQRQRDAVRLLAEEFGNENLSSRQEMMLQQVASLQDELVRINIRRISLETQVQMQQGGVAEAVIPGGMVERRSAIINSDPVIQGLTSDILQYEQLIVVGQQTMTPGNPELKQRIEVLKTLKERLVQRREEVATDFGKNLEDELAKNSQRRLVELEAELEQTIEYEQRIRAKLAQQDKDTIGMGHKQFAIDDQKEQLAHTKTRLDDIKKAIEDIRLESKRPSRISVAYGASSFPAQGERRKLAVALGFGGLALGVLLALLLDMADKSLHDPEDVVRRVGVRIIGTTTSPKHIDKLLRGRQLADDYQAIRANLGLLDGDATSKVIVVTSPGIGDGKTTFAVNLATSFAQSGEKVLLIDGDLRKPDIAEILNLPKGTRGLQDLLFGKEFEKLVYNTGTSGVHVLAADRRNASDALDLLGKTRTGECIGRVSVDYDHVIIDTPPVLAFSDALLWARMADGVILTSFVERTSRLDLKEAIERLERADARILGTVVNNVKVTHSYHRYGYGYGYATEGDTKRKSDRRSRDETLLLATEPKNKTGDELNS
ncbi:MAG: polysaccharide biosynthesis tyrosine autokinase [Planctomycetota bacterium]|jgi:capsular exopolysaccharide synthesis family protein